MKSENFTYGVVSEFGCMSIMITSPTDFNTFATKVRNGELSESWNAYIVGASGGGVDECIGQLLKFLDRNNSGLSVMFSSNIDESNPTWNAQDRNLDFEDVSVNHAGAQGGQNLVRMAAPYLEGSPDVIIVQLNEILQTFGIVVECLPADVVV